MNPNSLTALSLQDTLIITTNNVINGIANFIPRLFLSLLVLLVGLLIAGWVKSLVKSILHALSVSNIIANSPIQRFFEQADIKLRFDEIIGEIVRWSIMYIFLISAFSVVGLNSVSQFLSNLLNFLPQFFSALIIFIVGVVAAGLVESLVKNAVSAIDLATGRLAGKVASYTVVVFASLAAISELGIAKFFINTVFIGFIAMLSLGLGLALGLGAKDVVSDMLLRWYKRESILPPHKSKP